MGLEIIGSLRSDSRYPSRSKDFEAIRDLYNLCQIRTFECPSA